MTYLSADPVVAAEVEVAEAVSGEAEVVTVGAVEDLAEEEAEASETVEAEVADLVVVVEVASAVAEAAIAEAEVAEEECHVVHPEEASTLLKVRERCCEHTQA